MLAILADRFATFAPGFGTLLAGAATRTPSVVIVVIATARTASVVVVITTARFAALTPGFRVALRVPIPAASLSTAVCLRMGSVGALMRSRAMLVGAGGMATGLLLVSLFLIVGCLPVMMGSRFMMGGGLMMGHAA